ncbi:MAG: N-acetyl-gamma-glutamyl-phosphate reductase [Candidatus Omnitrophica bacterium]|nr:N-acetyl-gamma-glutamyl-phosphate reductase [Candidatus Omnitrophota bacterium]
MINVGIVGATGYAGEELISILLKHPQVIIKSLSAKISQPKKISDIFTRFKGRIDLICDKPNTKNISANCDLVFLALPHTASMDFVPDLLKAGKRIIDLSADYRLRDISIYEKFYNIKHKDKTNLKYAIYGLPEIYRNKIRDARLIANPGCYPTAAILALAPLVSLDSSFDLDSIIIDAKSGLTGAGRKPTEEILFAEANEDLRAYKVNVHQHMPEINQELSKLADRKVQVNFVPHIVPLNRGILATVYIKRIKGIKDFKQSLVSLYKRFYKNEPFVRIRPESEFPRLKDVVGTNFCDIGIREDGYNVIIISVIDNLLKGASGQAVQNMNIMYRLPERMGLL